ncbi:hypothetical protein MUN74_05315 [Agromyces endophyticus]|uniref:hypothetical protein n=1 Tax=Agromyces sp. H17E-10 TaxID=2932244 RepID=UPI001FD0D60E|nr:hypothetical protein [Agromyces sp. H17E-10]UOQ90339.1 hypothetical protein MUN74_05315 [Agromyces sp. H17E-10]
MDPKPGRWTSRLRAIVSLGAIAALVAGGIALFAAPAEAFAPMKREFENAAVTGGQCIGHAPTPLTVEITATYPDAPYDIVIWSGGVQVDEVTRLGDNSTISTSFTLPAGDYVVEISRPDGYGESSFGGTIPATVAACPDLDVATAPLACSLGDDGSTLITFTSMVPGEPYLFDVAGPAFSLGGPFVAASETEQREIVSMPPGNYTVYVQWSPEEPTQTAMFDWVAFAVEPCQPAIEVAVQQCTAAGGTAGATATLSNLEAGVEYTVGADAATATDAGTFATPVPVTGDASGAASVDLGALPPGLDIVVHVDGAWQAAPWEEPPWLGGGNFVPLGTVALAASETTSTSACPAVIVTPTPTPSPSPTPTPSPAPADAAGPQLAATGTDAGGALLAVALLIGLGAPAVMLAPRRRRHS